MIPRYLTFPKLGCSWITSEFISGLRNDTWLSAAYINSELLNIHVFYMNMQFSSKQSSWFQDVTFRKLGCRVRSTHNPDEDSDIWYMTHNSNINSELLNIHFFYRNLVKYNLVWNNQADSEIILLFQNSDAESDQLWIQMRIQTWYMSLHSLYQFWIDKYPFVLQEYAI